MKNFEAAIIHLEMHLLTALSARASEDFISGIERSIAIIKDLNTPIQYEKRRGL